MLILGNSLKAVQTAFLSPANGFTLCLSPKCKEIAMPNSKKIKIGIVGATGYTGVELLRLLSAHPYAEVCTVTSRSEAGVKLADYFPSLRGIYDLVFVKPEDAKLDQCDLVFFATPNGIAMKEAPALLARGVRVVDLSADFRLKDIAVWEKWYGMKHESPDWVSRAVYARKRRL